jgi:S-DNA-T family DNA segregation ATPase FtsK/SpoIIIE
MNPYDPVTPDPFAPYPPAGVDLIESLKHLLIVAGAWTFAIVSVTTVVLVAWRLQSPGSYEQYCAASARRMRWRLWAVFGWSRVAKACGLSASERVTRTNSEGKRTSTTKWTHPPVLNFSASGHCLHITVRTRTGQTVDDLELAVPAIRDSLRAHSARSVVVSPGTVRMEFVMQQHLSTPQVAAVPTQMTTSAIDLGRRENGSRWTLRVAGRHTLTVGCSGSGKGSIFWGIAGGLGPAVKGGVVHLLAVDLKYGIEVAIGAALFTKIATAETDAASMLQKVEDIMDERGRRMAGTARDHSPSAAEPLIVLLIDEMAGLTAYMNDQTLRKQVATSLSRILTKGRALGIVVVAFMQDPRKEILPMRGLFTQTIALRLRSRDEVTMVLGDGLADTASAHRINPNEPGTGYVIDEDGSVLRVRADHWPDSLIRAVAAQYAPKARKKGA